SAEHDNHHILIDVREMPPGGKLSAVDVWEVASALEGLGIGRHNRIAILNAPKDRFDRAKFLETCAANRGFNIRAFRDFEEALHCLATDWAGAHSSSDPPGPPQEKKPKKRRKEK